MTFCLATRVALLGLTPVVVAAQAPARSVQGTANLAYVNASGNSNVTTINASERLEGKVATIGLAQTFAIIYGRTEGVTSASLWRAGLRGDKSLGKKLSAYGLIAHDRNRFAGIARRFEEGLGVAVRLMESATDSLQVEGGASFVQQRSTQGVSSNYPSARTAGRYKHIFSSKAYFQHLLEVLPNLEETGEVRINSETALAAPLSDRFALRLEYAARYDSDPPLPGVKRLDRLFVAGVEVKF